MTTSSTTAIETDLPVRGRGRPTVKMQERLFRHILETALQVFMEQGFGSASVQQICATARISLATFYRHFRTKEDVFRASLQQYNEAHARALSTICGMPLEEGLLKAAFEHLDYVESANTHEMSRLLYAEARRFPGLAQQFLAGMTEWLAMLGDLIRQHCPAVGVTEAYDLSIMFMDMIGGRVENEHLFCVTPSTPQMNRRRARCAVGIFVAGLADLRLDPGDPQEPPPQTRKRASRGARGR